MAAYAQDPNFRSTGIPLTFLRQSDFSLTAAVMANPNTLLMLTIAILCLCLLIILVVFIMSIVIKNHANLERSSFLKKAFTLLLVSLLSFLHMPLFDVLVRTIFSAQADDSNLSI
jgi:hypothetical protein